MKTIDELFEKWENMPSYKTGYLLISDDHPLSFHIGYSGDLQKCFIVLNTGRLSKVASSKAISVENVLLDDNSYALKFVLNYPSLDEIFVKLCWDLMNTSKENQNPVEKLVAQYKKWLKLLQQVSSGLLPVLSQKGLVGELLYLSELIDKHGDYQALSEWVGPEGEDQDFNFDIGWAEVKTTSIDGSSIHISSLQQLDRLDEGTLVVFFLDKTPSNGNGTISLNEAISMVSSKITTEPAKELFELKIAKCGYQNKNADEYTAVRFKFSEKREYSVAIDFPRLSKRNIPSQITDAQYVIDLPSIESFRLSEE